MRRMLEVRPNGVNVRRQAWNQRGLFIGLGEEGGASILIHDPRLVVVPCAWIAVLIGWRELEDCHFDCFGILH